MMANKHSTILSSFPGVEIQSKTFEKSVGSRSRTPSIKAATAASASLTILKFNSNEKEDDYLRRNLGSAAKSVSAKSLTLENVKLSISQF